MADRDVTLDIVARDKTGPATKSAARNLKDVEKSWKDVDGQGKRTLAAAQKIAGDWGRGLSKISGHAKRWADSGDGAGKKFAKGLFSGIEKLGDLGSSIGGSLSKAVSAAGPYVQVAIAAMLATAAAVAAPVIGTAIGAAIVGGAGLGGMVGGLMLASKDARVAGAFESLKNQVTSQLEDAAQSFVPAALDAVKEARSAFRGMLPDIKRIFDVSSTFVGPLTSKLGQALQSIVSGIAQAIATAGPIINAIGSGIQQIGDAVGDVFRDLSDNGAGMATVVKGIMVVVEGWIRIFGGLINAMAEAFEWFVSKIPGGKAMLEKFTGSSDNAKTSAFNLAGGFQAVATDATIAAAGISQLKQKSDEFVNGNISLARAQIAARDATKTATQAITDNAKAKISNQEKSDRNMSALLNLADAFNTEATAGEKSGISAGKASAAYSTNRAKLVAMAEKAGFSKTKAEELAGQLLKMPKNVNTDINANTATASTALTTFQRKINGLHGKTVVVNVRVNSDGSHHVSGPGGSGTLTFAGYQSWRGSDDSSGTSRTGGPTKVESTINQTVNVLLDGELIDRKVDRKIAAYDRKQKVGRR